MTKTQKTILIAFPVLVGIVGALGIKTAKETREPSPVEMVDESRIIEQPEATPAPAIPPAEEIANAIVDAVVDCGSPHTLAIEFDDGSVASAYIPTIAEIEGITGEGPEAVEAQLRQSLKEAIEDAIEGGAVGFQLLCEAVDKGESV